MRRIVASWAGWLAAAGAFAATTCEQSGGEPGRETTVTITIAEPAGGDVIAPTGGCGGQVVVSGTFAVEGPPVLHDFYVVIDASGSTEAFSGADVDEDGTLGDAGDSIYQAEIAAAQAFVRALDPAASRVAVIVFNRNATVRQQLTADLAAALAVLEAMKGDRPRWGTGYVPAMEAVRLEMLARGDLAGRVQRCVFLSDGQPDEPLAETDAKARELLALGLYMDTFALGFPDSDALVNMAAITGGTFTALSTPGAILDLLPSFVPDIPRTLESVEEVSGTAGVVVTDDATGTFQATVTLRPGANRVTLTLTAGGGVTVSCTIDVTMPEPLIADAGPPQRACAGERVTLSAAASAFACADPRFRWLDCAGAEIAGWSGSPLLDVDACALPCEDVTLEIGCGTDACVGTATTRASCRRLETPAPRVVSACGLLATLDCGAADPALTVDWDLDAAADSDGDGDPRNDGDASGCVITHAFPAPGAHDVTARVSDAACVVAAPLTHVATPLPAARSLGGGLCPGARAAFTCGTPSAGASYWWDFDELTDGDGDGDATNDRDADGCDAEWSWLVEGSPGVHGWEEDAEGCRRIHAAGRMDVSAGALPGEAADLKLRRSGDEVAFAWSAVPGASFHRVLRGDLLRLHGTGAYDHLAADGEGRGACEVRGPATHADPDDAAGPEAYYYLVTAVSDCGGEGPAGHAFDGRVRTLRPGRAPSADCP